MKHGHRKGAEFKKAGPGALSVMLFCAFGPSAQAAPVGTVTDLSDPALTSGYALVDIRPDSACAEDALEGARCLPGEWVFNDKGELLINFHALRWLLGTIGLSGAETLVVHASPETSDTARSIAALAYLAGQTRVFVYEDLLNETGPGGETRSFSRETVYTAPMRDSVMSLTEDSAKPMQTRLSDFAIEGGQIAFSSQL